MKFLLFLMGAIFLIAYQNDAKSEEGSLFPERVAALPRSLGEIGQRDWRVDPVSGSMVVSHKDFEMSGVGPKISLFRVYSLDATDFSVSEVIGDHWNNVSPYWGVKGNAGYGWMVRVAPTIQLDGLNTGHLCAAHSDNRWKIGFAITLLREDGTKSRLYPIQDYLAKSAAGWKLTCNSGAYELRDSDGLIYKMEETSTSLLCDGPSCWGDVKRTILEAKKIKDVNGNELNLAYIDFNGARVLKTVSADDGRRIEFNYVPRSGSVRISSISNQSGDVWNYLYRTDSDFVSKTGYAYVQGLLVGVQPPIGGAYVYDYGVRVDGVFDWTYAQWASRKSSIANSERLSYIKYPSGGWDKFKYNFNGGLVSDAWMWAYIAYSDPPQAHDVYSNAYEEQYMSPANLIVGGNRTLPNSNACVEQIESSDSGFWKFTYNPSVQDGVYDVLTVTYPDGVAATYSSIGWGYVRAALFVPGNEFNWLVPGVWCGLPGSSGGGYNCVSNSAWKIGLLTEVSLGAGKRTITYQPRILSSTTPVWVASNIGSQVMDSYAAVPDVKSETLVLDGAQYVTDYASYDGHGNPLKVVRKSPGGAMKVFDYVYDIDESRNLIRRVKTETVTLSE